MPNQESSVHREAWPAWAPALLLALATGFFLVALNLRAPAARQPVALLFNPAITSEGALRQVAALDGRIVRVGGWRNVVVAVFDRDLEAGQLWRHGAWLALDPVLFGGCGPVDGSFNSNGFAA